jgi:hypothetical protein
MTTTTTRLMTAGLIANQLGEPLHRVQRVLATRDIRPAARAGTLRVYDRDAVERVRIALADIDARRTEGRS